MNQKAVYLPERAVNALADVQAAALQRRPNRRPELATLAAGLRIRLPGYPSQRTDRCVGGAPSFLIRDVTASLRGGEQHYKDRLSGLGLGALGHRWDEAFKPSVNDSRGFREFPWGSHCEIGDRLGRTSVTRGPNIGEISAVVCGGCAGPWKL